MRIVSVAVDTAKDLTEESYAALGGVERSEPENDGSSGGYAAGGGTGKSAGLQWWDSATGESTMLAGHTQNVCALAAASNGDLLSGSWDYTARVWRAGTCFPRLAMQRCPLAC